MNLTVSLPKALEQQLTDYCRKNRIARSEAVKRAVAMLLGDSEMQHPFIGCDTGQGDVSGHVKRLLRERFRGQRE